MTQQSEHSGGTMNCPRCDGAVLAEKDREGIVVDVCPNCRGIWLDRGELEKLITKATREFEEVAVRRDTAPVREYRRDDDDDDDRRRDYPPGDDYRRHDDDYNRHHRKKRGIFESLADMFD
jgi:uncharacterized protein